ncbi:unnamed protein product [Darwinula stevensoni]|uniref:DUF7869 domain-containing protein n=1 Tax=Darwinula stevensoni TaxID=69355 RepID=A0A7R9ABM5_9CRUS|nr:unnamed protein product [Darwinula stevensoni]CAG0899085.1 unnamed protein product [Darwinula stevensoni]
MEMSTYTVAPNTMRNTPPIWMSEVSCENFGIFDDSSDVIGVMVYTGKGIREFAFVDMGQFPHDSNLCVEVISTLLHVKMDLKNKLFLQMDICARENKNKFICVLAYLLVETGIFEEEFLRDQQRMHKDSLPMFLNRDAFTISRSPMNMKNSIYQMMISWRWKVELAYTQL